MPEPPCSPHRRLGLMAKYWTAGDVKTRLGTTIGMAAAADLHRNFLMHLCQQLCGVGAQREVVVAPGNRMADVQNSVASSWNVVAQTSGDLGNRMSAWFTRSTGGASQSKILIGADCPTLSHDVIAGAFLRLHESDMVVGPAVDGGFYLIGFRGVSAAKISAVFRDVPWSDLRTLAVTLENAEAAGLSIARLAQAEDVDTVKDLQSLTRRLSAATDRADKRLLHQINQVLQSHSVDCASLRQASSTISR